MPERTRRSVLKGSGALLGGVALGSTGVTASGSERFIITTNGNAMPSGVDVVHEMPGVDLAVVHGSESALQGSPSVTDYAPDPEGQLDLPVDPARAPTVEEADVSPDDASTSDAAFYGLQWDKQDLDVPEAHGTTTGDGTRVAIIDTGVAAGHPDLDVNVGLSRDFTGDGYGAGKPIAGTHGTHVAGITAANGFGALGTAPDAEVVDCRVFSPLGGGTFGDVLAAVVHSVVVDADVANLSLGAYPVPRQGLGSFYGKALNRVMTYANSRGTLVVASAGNDAADLQHDGSVISLPNEGAQGMSIAATGPSGFALSFDIDDLIAPPGSPAVYTNYGTNGVSLGAPGGDFDPSLDFPVGGVPAYAYDWVFNTFAFPIYDDDGGLVGVDHSYGWILGTSMAAPNVSGAAAVVKSANPGYNANQVESALERAADVPGGYDKSYYGSGYLNVLDAL